jgi:hypothetical protein
MPMLKRVYPTMIMEEGMIHHSWIWDDEAEQLRGCTFLSKSRLKRLIKTWRPIAKYGGTFIAVVEYESGKPTSKTWEKFRIPEQNDDFIVKLANLSDLHGIIKMHSGHIWLRKVNDPKELNIDETIVDRIANKLGLEGFGK